jgi:short subunit fatty acids transporter
MDKHTAAVYVALITAVGGLAASLANHFDPAEPMAESSYAALKPAFVATSSQVEELTARVFRLETLILKMIAATPKKQPKKAKKAKKAKNKALKKAASDLVVAEKPKAETFTLASGENVEITALGTRKPWTQQQLPSLETLRSQNTTPSTRTP